MIFAFFTALLWSVAGFSSSRISRVFGAARANAMRLTGATLVLVLLAGLTGNLLWIPGANLFLLSGILHLAIGDLGLFAVYRRLGPRIGALAVSCLAPFVALLVEWARLGTVIPVHQLILAALVLASVVLAVAPRERKHLSPRELRLGILAGLVATIGQGSSGAVTRMGYAELADAGMSIGPWMPALLRCGAGAAGMLLYVFVQSRRRRGAGPVKDLLPHRRIQGHPAVWLAASTLLGPVAGVLMVMKAYETTPAALVHAVLALLPVLMIPVAWFFDGNAPSRRSIVCGILAVALVVRMILV